MGKLTDRCKGAERRGKTLSGLSQSQMSLAARLVYIVIVGKIQVVFVGLA